MPASQSPPPVDLDSADAQQRLAHLEALLAGSLFDAARSPSPATASAPVQHPPNKRKKTSHSSPPPPTAPAEVALQPQEAVGELSPSPSLHRPARAPGTDSGPPPAAFRLFSSQKAPQRVVLREAETPPPFVVDRRVRCVPLALFLAPPYSPD